MTQQKPLRSVPAGGPVEPPLRRTALALLIAACFSAAHANPVLPQVVHGQATFNQQGNLFTITNTPNTIINWQSFSVNPGEITRFLQQNAGSSVLNRITGQDPSKILGSLQSNGKVFLINPNGVLFGRDARVDVAGLVASSLALSNQDFLAGKMHFNAGEQAGAVLNQGTIHAGSGGQILLIAPTVENSGIITAPNGDVLLAAGHSVQLADAANPDLRVVLSAPADQAINVGQIVAQGGRIGMVGALLHQRGVLNANSAVVGENGKIVLKATGKALLENGSVTSATSAVGKGGEITVLGDQVGMQGNARVDASGATGGGTVLLGGDYQGKNPALANARQVAVGKDATIAADAMQSGDGGKVIVWGNETARVFGSISARGGAASGNGGLVETSGHYLAVDGIRVDTSARRGKRGNWLLDPYDIEVVSGYHGQLQDFDEFSDGPLDTTIGADTISDASSTVTLQATHRITFNAGINMVTEGAGLVATAGESIYVRAPITTQRGEVTLSANDAASSQATGIGIGANVYLNAAISTNGGNVELSGASIISDIAGGGTVNVGSGKLSLQSKLAGGSIELNGFGDQLAGSGVSGQTVLLQADNIHFSGTLNFGGNGSLAALTFKPLTNGRQIELGSQSDTALALTSDELNRVAAGTVNIGDASSGNITISGPVSLELTGGIAALNLETGGTLTASSKLAMRQAGSVLKVTAADVIVASGGGLSAEATVSLVADNMSLGGAAQSIAAGAGTGTVSLKRRSNSGSIEIGSAGEDSADSLGLSDSELKTISAPSIAIGGSDYAGTLNLQGALDLRASSKLNLLELRSAGNINLNGALAVGKGLTIGAGGSGSDWFVHANGIVNVGGAFVLDGGNWVQNNASLPAFTAHSFRINNGTFLRVKGGNGEAATPYKIADVYGLQGIGTQGYNKNYALVANINASGTANWNLSESRTGFAPLFSGDEFAYAGIFDGGNHSISGLTINGGANPSVFGSGLFARTQGGIIRNLSMVGGSVTGGNNVGAVVGNNGGATISNVSSSMAVSGNNNVGGLVGDNDGAISQAYATGAVGGGASVGGLVGRNGGTGTIEDAYATGAIGLSANSAASQQNLGGVIGWSVAGSRASRLYFSGAVSGSGFAPGTVGAVVGRADSGAVVGPAFFDINTTGTILDQGGSTGRSTAEMKQQSSFGGFNFGESAIWRIYDGHTTPLLKAFLTPLTVTASGATSRVYDGQVASVGPLSYIGLLNGDLAASGTASYGNARNVGNYALGGLWSTQYDISYAGTSTVAITPRALSVILSGSKVYDGQLGFANATFSLGNKVSTDTVGVTGSAQFVDKNAGSVKAVNLSELTLSGSAMGNYSLASTAIGTAEITQRTLNLTFAGANKVYDGGIAASLTITDNRVAGDVLTATASGAFADKNAGSNKVVTVQNASLSGLDASNYTLGTTGGTAMASIAQRALNLGYTGVDKVYDGVSGAQVAISDDRIPSDVLNASASAAFADKNAGSGKTITVQNASLSGNDAGNYRLANTTGATTGTIARAALTLASVSASDKVYDGTQVANVSGTVAGVIGQDAVSLAGGSGTFADRNYGSGKTVNVSGFGLSGADAGNYALTSTGGVAQASIAQRALSTWIGAAGGLWSDAANWEGGVAPSGANVLAADFAASTGNVVYTAAAGDTVLDRLSSRGGLNLTGGSLLVNNALTVANYAQTGGLLGGLGNMTVSNSFSQSAGAIHIGGNLAVTQAAGDLRFAALTANAISLNAGAGAISQSGAVVAGSLAAQSQTGTVLNDAGNRVKNFSAGNNGAGGIALTNNSAPEVLVLGGLATGSGDVRIESTGGIESHAINANSGNVSLIAHSLVNVQGVVQGNDVTVDASTDVAFGDGARVNAARAIAVTAGTGVTFAGAARLDVQATGGIAVLAKNGDLTAAETVRINSRRAPVSLLAPNGRVNVPASVLVAQPVTTPVVPPSTIISAGNALPAFSAQYNPLNQLNKPNNVTTPLLASATSKESTKEAPDELQKSIKKTYCN